MVKQIIATPFGGNGKSLTNLLLKAAGLDGKRVRRLVCTCESGKVITFEAEMYGDEDKIGDAMNAVDVTHVTDGVAEYVPCP